jgi:hypothetical protein
MSTKRPRKTNRSSKKRTSQPSQPITPEEKAYNEMVEAEGRAFTAYWNDLMEGIFAKAYAWEPPKSAEIIPFPKARQ